MPVMAPIRPTCPSRTQQQCSPARQDHAVLPADPRAVAEARRLVRTAIRSWEVPVDAETVALLTSELMTNAVTHGAECPEPRQEPRQEPIATVTLLIIGSRDDGLRVEVHDASPVPPEVGHCPLESAEHGRGMLLVEMLASKWGSYRTGIGKAVFFTLGIANGSTADAL